MFFGSSDFATVIPDFYFKLNFWRIVEFTDNNANNIFEILNDTIVNFYNLGGTNISWSRLQFTNLTLNETSGKYYLEGSQSTVINYMNITILYRISNFKMYNATWSLPIEPYSVTFNFKFYPINNNLFSNGTKFALLINLIIPNIVPQLLFDNTESSKTNLTTGISIGEFVEGRFDWLSNISFSNITNSINSINSTNLNITDVVNTTSDEYVSTIALVFNPVQNYTINTTNSIHTMNISGFVFINTDSLVESNGSSGLNKLNNIDIYIVCAFIISIILLI
jgi:hypothetical protein